MDMRVTGTIASLCFVTASLAVPLAGSPARPQGQPESGVMPAKFGGGELREVVNRYCVACHNQRLKTGGLTLDTVDTANVPADAAIWEGVVRKLRAGMMPPQGMPRPDEATRRALVTWLETALDRAPGPTPGRSLAHRLNRTEYANAIRDLLSLDVDVTALLPPDDSSYGFDNVADVLGVSPVLQERYLSAAERISDLAVGDLKALPSGQIFRVRQDASQDRHVDGLPLGTVGGTLIRTTLPLDAEYVLEVKLFRTNLGTTRGLEYQQQLEISVDGQRVHLAAFGGNDEVTASSDNPTLTGDAVDARFTVRVPMKAGPRAISVAFIEKTAAQNTRRLQPFLRSSADTIDFSGLPHIDSVTLRGPFNATAVGDTPSRRRIFTCRPRSQAEERACATQIVTTLAHRAYRGESTPADVERLLAFYDLGRAKGDFDSGIKLALRRILASPKFLFRTVRPPEGAGPQTVYRISALELASRLSFFLWSSIPDDELLDLAIRDELKTPQVLEQQVRRMLRDPKSRALVDNFAGQWLHLRNLKNKVPNSSEFPDFDDNLRRAMLTETELFVSSIAAEDRSVLDLLNADYTFMNERLARHYGIRNVYGSRFRRVTVTDDTRRGLLGHGSILTVTSHAHRTSPVLRGKWILENVLGVPAPPPPADVPAFEEDVEARRPTSVRERMERHRRNPVCASCHQIMDPIGFALENFDAVGAWRNRDGGTRGDPIDASGQLVDGLHVNGPIELRQALLRDPRMFVGTLTERLMVYALGRGIAYFDMPVVRAIVRGAEQHNYRFTALLMGIVSSNQFQMQSTAPASEDGAPVASAAERKELETPLSLRRKSARGSIRIVAARHATRSALTHVMKEH
jgi:mono/diheme cytochrome c family protein